MSWDRAEKLSTKAAQTSAQCPSCGWQEKDTPTSLRPYCPDPWHRFEIVITVSTGPVSSENQPITVSSAPKKQGKLLPIRKGRL